MRIREVLLAGAAVIAGLGLLGHPGNHPGSPHAIMVVPGPPPISTARVASTSEASPARTAVGDPEAETDSEPAGPEEDYPYWEHDDAGIWATPAEFSEPE